MPNASEMHFIITSRSLTAKEMTTLDAIEVTEMKPSKARELFQRYAKLTEEGPGVRKEVDGIVRELGYLVVSFACGEPIEHVDR